MPLLKLRLGRALLSVVEGFAKFVWLRILNTSVRNSKFIDSEKRNRLARIMSSCRKLGPDNAFREKLPNVPGEGVENAAGLIMLRSSLRYGLPPATRFGRLMLRELPPPGV